MTELSNHRIEETRLQLSFGRVRVRSCGFSEPGRSPLVLVHGLVVSSDYMVPLARAFSNYSRVYAPDLPGYGTSDKPDRALSLDQLAEALHEIVDRLGYHRVHLLGNSFGCQIIATFAVRFPQRVDRLVLQGPTVDPQSRSFPAQLFKLLWNSRLEPSSEKAIMARDYWRAGGRIAAGTIREMLDDRIEAKLPGIAAPTLIVRGGRDPIVTQRWAEEALSLLPRGSLKVIPGGSHTLNYTSPLELARVAVPFLGLGPPAGPIGLPRPSARRAAERPHLIGVEA
jgi:2-hydroxy-6-oxonona-2,4-dienedioate hydrolase